MGQCDARGDGPRGGVVFASVWVFGAAGVWFTACVGTVDGSIGCRMCRGDRVATHVLSHSFVPFFMTGMDPFGCFSCFCVGSGVWSFELEEHFGIGGKFGRCYISQHLK